MNIVIVGDSFSSDQDENSWVSMLSNDHTLNNLSQRGISEYRIFKIVKENLLKINQADLLILFHTSPSRIYVPNSVDYPARLLYSHPTCDMVAGDALASPKWKSIAEIYYKNFYDDQFQQDFFNLLVKEIRQIVKVKMLNFSGFNSDPDITSFADLYKKYPGSINHLTADGNKIIYKHICEEINKCV